MKTLYITLFLIFSFYCSFAQVSIRGRVFDKNTNLPIENATIYYNQTQIGTLTNKEGAFMIYSDNDYHELVISCVGYEKMVIKDLSNPRLKILLSPVAETLKEVTISAGLGWKKWGKLFTKLLMGDDSHDYYSSKYKYDVVLNPKVLNFAFDNKTNVLTVRANKPLYVIHERLGYLIALDLDQFEYNIVTEEFRFKITSYYEPTKSSSSLEQIQLSTNHIFQGSRQHFFNALANKNLKEEGFEIYKYSATPNIEKQRVSEEINRLKYKKMNTANNSIISLKDLINNSDTLQYYAEILKQQDFMNEKIEEVNLDSIVRYDENNKIYGLKFQGSLLVKYSRDRKKLALHTDYKNPQKGLETYSVETILTLIDEDPFYFNASGQSFTNNLYYWGYMSKKRLADILPQDFDPNIPRVKVKNNALKKLKDL